MLEGETDISRGDLICDPRAPAEVADQFDATIVWMHEEPLLPGRRYLLKIGATTVPAQVTQIKHQINVNTLEHLAARHLDLNAIGECNLSLDRAVPFDAYRDHRDTGGFILIDRMSNDTVAAGMMNFALRRAHNIHRQHVDVDKAARARLKHQRPCVLWFTGLSGSGKSTVSNLVEKRLHALGHHTYLLDGDNVRHGLNKDLGFTDADRVENIRRVVEVAKLMVDAGLIVMTAFISPFRAERQMARALLADGEFIEVYMDTPLAVAEQRDPKGLYLQGAARRTEEFHRHRLALRSPRSGRRAHRHGAAECGAGGRIDRADAGGARDCRSAWRVSVRIPCRMLRAARRHRAGVGAATIAR